MINKKSTNTMNDARDLSIMATPQPLILASSSPFRRELLTRLQLKFQSDSPNIDETRLPDEPPKAMVERLSIAKTKAVSDKYPNSLIIGSDQCAVLDDQIIGKPGNHKKAVQQLKSSSGRSMDYHVGLCLYDSSDGSYQYDTLPFRVHFRALTDEEIEHYLRIDQPYNCAGSFRSESLGITLFTKLEGDDPSTLMGLPLIRLSHMLRRKGWQI